MSRLDEGQIAKALEQLPGWTVRDGGISKSFEFSSYPDGVLFASACAQLAEQRDHHPDMLLTWRKVCISLSTHSEGGITEKDVDMATRIEAIAGGGQS